MKVAIISLLILATVLFSTTSADIRAKRAINPFLDSMGKRAVNPFLDSIGKRALPAYFMIPSRQAPMQKRYFDSLAGQSLGKRSAPPMDMMQGYETENY